MIYKTIHVTVLFKAILSPKTPYIKGQIQLREIFLESIFILKYEFAEINLNVGPFSKWMQEPKTHFPTRVVIIIDLVSKNFNIDNFARILITIITAMIHYWL